MIANYTLSIFGSVSFVPLGRTWSTILLLHEPLSNVKSKVCTASQLGTSFQHFGNIQLPSSGNDTKNTHAFKDDGESECCDGTELV